MVQQRNQPVPVDCKEQSSLAERALLCSSAERQRLLCRLARRYRVWHCAVGSKLLYPVERDLKRKIMLTDFYPVEPGDCCDDTFLGDIRVDVIPEQLAFGSSIEKALEDWGHELTEIHTLLGCCELLAGMAEEAAELSQAALKLRRTIDKSNPTPVSTSEASHRLNEEFADVVLCAAALGLDREEVERFIREKAARWSMRLEVDD